MDYANAFTKTNADDMYAVYDAEQWLKDLESHGATVADLKKRITILQAVTAKMETNAKIELNGINVRETYTDALAFHPEVFKS